QVLENRHLAKEVAFLERGEHACLSRDGLEQFDGPGLDDVHLRSDLALGEDDVAHRMTDDVFLEWGLAGGGSGLEDRFHRTPASRKLTTGASPSSMRTRIPRGSAPGSGTGPAGKWRAPGKGALFHRRARIRPPH